MTNRRVFRDEFKTRVVLDEMISAEKGLAQTSREYSIKVMVMAR